MIDFEQFNIAHKANPNIVTKALSSAATSGGVLSPEQFEQIVSDHVVQLVPEIAMLDTKSIAGKSHRFPRKIANPAVGGAQGETGATRVTQSQTRDTTVDLKIYRRKGSVTNFIQDATRENLDAAAYEMDNHLLAQSYDIRNSLYHGNKAANVYEFDGWETFISTNRRSEKVGQALSSLKYIDDMLDANVRRGGQNHNKFISMSPELLSTASRLETSVRKNTNIGGGFDMIVLEGGWRLASYRGCPIIQTTALRPVERLRSAITATAVTGAGIADGTYYVNVSPVTINGEQIGGIEKTVTLGTGDNKIDVYLDAAHTDKDSVVNTYAYHVFLGSSTGDLPLVAIVPAISYDGNGAITGNDGLVGSSNKITLDSLTARAEVPAHQQADRPFPTTDLTILDNNIVAGNPLEQMALIDMDPIQGLGKVPYTNTNGSKFKGLVTTEALARDDDFFNFMVKSYLAVADSWEATSYWFRGIKAA